MASLEFIANRDEQIAPLIPSVQPTWTQTAFNGSLLRENVYRYPAGAEVDAAWEAMGVNCMLWIQCLGGPKKLTLSSDRPIVVPEHSGRSMGLVNQVHIKEQYGGGFPANVEVRVDQA
jgi:hypothetical protein